MEAKKVVLYLLVLAVIFAVIFLPGYSALQKLRQENEQYTQRIKLLEEYNDQLKSELYRMREDPDYIEKKAREKLGIIRKGEVIYRRTED